MRDLMGVIIRSHGVEAVLRFSDSCRNLQALDDAADWPELRQVHPVWTDGADKRLEMANLIVTAALDQVYIHDYLLLYFKLGFSVSSALKILINWTSI